VVKAPTVVMRATAQELVTKLNTEFDAVRTLTTTVDVIASVGGGTTGQVTDYRPFHGYIIIEKPRNLRVILQVPVLGSRGMDMVSDGSTFKMVIPIESQALTGKDEVVKPSPKPLENLRPGIFFDSMLIPGVQPNELVSMTESSRVIQPLIRKQPAIQEPDYDLTMLRKESGYMLGTIRTVHINRITLLPYRQDIFDANGKLSTTATYDGWQKFSYTGADGKTGQIDFPTIINIDRPVDQYQLKITVTKVTPNQTLAPDQFELCIPAGDKLRDMDDPGAPATIAPSSSCATQSPH
jgi:outer membrane lipoprotein-sorting protein